MKNQDIDLFNNMVRRFERIKENIHNRDLGLINSDTTVDVIKAETQGHDKTVEKYMAQVNKRYKDKQEKPKDVLAGGRK